MLNVSASIIIPPNISIDTPNKYLVPIPIGQLSRVLISFPYGAGWLVGVSLWYQNFPLLPIHRDTWIKGNDYTFDLHSTRNLNQEPFQIEVRGYNLDTVFQHEILFVFEINERIGLSDVEKQTLKFMSDFSEILITTEGEVGEISSPLHVSTKVLTRPDYLTGNPAHVYYNASLAAHGFTPRITYTVPTGKRAFFEYWSLNADIPLAGDFTQFLVELTLASVVSNVRFHKIGNTTPLDQADVIDLVKLYLHEGDTIKIYTSVIGAGSYGFRLSIRYYEFTPTQ